MGAIATIAAGIFSSEAVVAGVASAVAGSVVSDALAGDAPKVKAPTAMPDPMETQKAREKSIMDQMARRGRASTILTDGSNSQKLGG